MQEQNTDGWPAPPAPEMMQKEEPQMSELSTLTSIFFEPGRTFEDLRRKPRFVMALAVIIVMVWAFSFAFYYKVGEDGFRRFSAEQLDKNPQAQGMTPEQKSNAVDLNMTIISVFRYALPILIILGVAIGGLIYWLAAKAFGGSGNFWHGVSTWVYSSLPPTVVGMIANLIILLFKSVDEIDIATSQRGVIQANPSMFLDGKSMPVLTTLLSTFDLFTIWGWVLAAIGLRIMNKISSGSAWAITIILALVSIAVRVISAYFSGNPS